MEDESGSLLPTEAGRTLWVEVAPHYERNGNGGQGHLFSTDFTAEMEESLDGIEIGTTAAPLAWHTFAEHFQALHQVALEKKKLSPTPKQVAFFERLAANMTEEEVNGYTGGKETSALSGSEMRDILDRITKDRPPESQPASEKQVSWIASLAEGIGLSEADACAHVALMCNARTQWRARSSVPVVYFMSNAFVFPAKRPQKVQARFAHRIVFVFPLYFQ